ncbi:MAG TPA: type IV secretory system conjugative DNA transfer family protein [Desulfobulbaceae bacterium]|nr:type IV secretory system conjugative DNA transfer family protein [Desulfobulbaceae bacterium]
MTDILSGMVQVFKLAAKLLLWLLKHLWTGTKFTARKIFTRKSRTFGTAHWATRRDLRKAGALGGDGLIVGKAGRKFLRYNDPEGTALVFAPQGAGKGVGIVIPNLLDYKGSILVTDPKGENFAITAGHRRTMGPVWCLNLAQPEASNAFNPLDTIRTGTTHETDDAEILADLMLVHEPHTSPHWREMATNWLAGFILYVVHKHKDTPELRTLTEVRAITNQPPDAFQSTLEEMSLMGKAKIHETANEILRSGDSDEARSILTNMGKATKIFAADKPPALITGQSDFSLESINDQTTTVYLVVPEEKLTIYAPLLRVMVGLTINALLRAGRERSTPEHPTLLLLDEAAALGYMGPLEQGMGYLRAYARSLLIFQDLHQLRQTYPKAGSIISNSKCQVAFGVNDFETAEALSKRIGQETIKSRSEGQSQASDALLKHQQQAGESETARWLIDPSEILRLPADEMLVFMGKQVKAPIRAKAFRYYKERYFRGLFDSWRDAPTPDLQAKVEFSGGHAPDAGLASSPSAVDTANQNPDNGLPSGSDRIPSAPKPDQHPPVTG